MILRLGEYVCGWLCRFNYTNAEDLQKFINVTVVQGFCIKWRLKSNIKKSAIDMYMYMKVRR